MRPFRPRSGKTKGAGLQDHVDELTIRILPESPQPAVAVSGRVTIDSSPSLRSALLDLLRDHTAPVLVVDLSGVSYLDASGLATLFEASNAARQRSVKLRVVGMGGQPRTLLEVTNLDKVFRAAGSEVELH